ncbi:MAG: TetR family transcriptional regulator [candidate division Zixibacteria bacterium]|nr:TetR family transcriptional regulator [candidate division Zixibacteria bacterium]
MRRNNRDNRTRRRILKAARRLFSARGYHGVSITDLAAAAKVNRAVLYYYFKNKRDLYRETIKSVLELIPALWERAEVREGPPAERLDNYVAALWRALAENRDALPLIMREISTGGPERELIFKRYVVPNAVHVADILEDGMARGEFADAPPLMAAVSVLSGMIMPNFGLAVGRPFFGEAGELLSEGRAYVDFYRGYVRRALGVKPAKGGGRRGASK